MIVVNRCQPRNAKRYRVGIDVGTNSVGLVAIEIDDAGRPSSILSAISHIHDSGVLEHKTATTRLAAAGIARRLRRLHRKRSKRLAQLDVFLAEQGWTTPGQESGETQDPYVAWRARARLATGTVDDIERGALLAVALRHIARHRGWRNPYTGHKTFYEPGEYSEFFQDFRKRVEAAVGHDLPGCTVAELAEAAIDIEHMSGSEVRPLRIGKTAKARLEKPFSYLGGKLLQVDNANEIHAYALAQGWNERLLRAVIDHVFIADSPRGSWVSKVGKDPFDGRLRAPKATDAFQRFRIVSVLANVRVREGNEARSLTVEERRQAFNFLLGALPTSAPTWSDVANELGLRRGAMFGVAAVDDEGAERLPLRPPTHVTDAEMRSVKPILGTLKAWWSSAGAEQRDALVVMLTDGFLDETTLGGAATASLLEELDEEALAALDRIGLPAGRGSYSAASLRALTDRMLASNDDLHAARKAVFGVSDDWAPPIEPVGAPVGNPAVDRVTKVVARWLGAAEAEWGAPEAVTIEHVRESFMSESAARERDREMRNRFDAAEKRRQQLKAGGMDRVRDSDVRRYQAITRQKGQCAYCGDTITMESSEMDHVVPRKGVGSTNTRTNLLAVCVPCNRSKRNIPFAVWAGNSSRPSVSVEEAVARTKHWTRDAGASPLAWNAFLAEVTERLKRTEEDPEIDARSMESVAWMANELRERIDAHFRAVSANGRGGTTTGAATNVYVYQGAVTAGARQAAGIAARIPFAGGGGKTRLDRRHHAVDAAVIALMDASTARTLAERNSMRSAQFYEHNPERDWRDHRGSNPAAQERFATWKGDMRILADLLDDAFVEDRIVVTENLRLRLGSGKAHDDTIHPMTRRKVGGAFTREQIDAAGTPALWTALTCDLQYSPAAGLPANPARTLRLHGTRLCAEDTVALFDKPRAAIAVRGGWTQLGDSIHHIRIYRWDEKGKTKYGMLRVFTADLVRHRHENLFTVEPKPSWISMRVAHPAIGRSDFSGKEYLGWLVPGDELLVDMTPFKSEQLRDLQDTIGMPTRMRWRLAGSDSPVRVSLKPASLAWEGLDKWARGAVPTEAQQDSLTKLLKTRGWLIAANTLFGEGDPIIIRRDALGRPRLESKVGLPVTWRIR